MNSLITKIFISLLLLVTFANAADLQVRPADENIIELNPRSTATSFFNIANQSENEREIQILPQLPPDWKIITQKTPYFGQTAPLSFASLQDEVGRFLKHTPPPIGQSF